MTSDWLGVVVELLPPVVLSAIVVAAVATARRRRLGPRRWAGLAAVGLVLLTAWWVFASPLVIDGQTCLDVTTASGLLDDSASIEQSDDPVNARACQSAARRIVGLGLAATLAAGLAAIALLRQRSPVSNRNRGATRRRG